MWISDSILEKGKSKMGGWRIALGLLGILFVLWVTLSIMLNSYMTNEWQNEWWQILIALTIFWLFYVLIAYLAYYISHE